MTQADNSGDVDFVPAPDRLREVSTLLDRETRSRLAKLTHGISPAALIDVWTDWSLHILFSPGRRAELAQRAVTQGFDLWRYGMMQAMGGDPDPIIAPDAHDRRFRHPGWAKPPYSLYAQGFLLAQDWWRNATTDIRGMSAGKERAAAFMMRQQLDAFAPSNLPWMNPEVIERTAEEGGANLRRGAEYLLEDMRDIAAGRSAGADSPYKVGENLAVTPGKVVYRNHLIELIQYAPKTGTVRPEPVLIVPAWIMKYYILDLSPENSMVRYLVGQGFTVYMISWRNPGAGDRELGMADYLRMGPGAALAKVREITGTSKVHLTGYCLGGTLAAIHAAALAREGDDSLASLSLFAAQTDFTEAGELTLFISEGEVDFLEDLMWSVGYLDANQMSGAFQILRSNDLIWSRIQRHYLLGERAAPNDLMSWNQDSTRMPYRMHSEYLHKLFLQNDLANGRFEVDGAPVFLSDIRVPIFAVGTESDHVAPWRSAYKIAALSDADTTFVLTNGGHNAGVVSEPGHPNRHYRIRSHHHGNVHLSADAWMRSAKVREGSWWPEWTLWLGAHSGLKIAPPEMPVALCDAPGTYVHMK